MCVKAHMFKASCNETECEPHPCQHLSPCRVSVPCRSVLQVWDLLPAFCSSATDIAVSFKRIARSLGAGMEQNELRATICTSLAALVAGCETDADRKAVGAFSKNFLPILFNLYCTDETPDADKVRLYCIRRANGCCHVGEGFFLGYT